MKTISQRILIFLARYLGYYQFFHQYIILILKKKNQPKIFCVGYVKTGLTSLYNALNILGYRSVRLLRGCVKPKEGWVEYIKKCKYDAYLDYPLYEDDLLQKIDKSFPNSKFILTLRNEKSWEKSYENFYNVSPENLKIGKQYYNNHNKNVIAYFKDKTDQLLVMNISEGDGWEKLCSFLNKPLPKKPFPYKNKQKY